MHEPGPVTTPTPTPVIPVGTPVCFPGPIPGVSVCAMPGSGRVPEVIPMLGSWALTMLAGTLLLAGWLMVGRRRG